VDSTVSLAHVGFVTAKYQGDGYYSQIDGVHTVAYHVSAGSATPAVNFDGSYQMQGSLATTPTEDDWFDIAIPLSQQIPAQQLPHIISLAILFG
jgi:hypothetical protein